MILLLVQGMLACQLAATPAEVVTSAPAPIYVANEHGKKDDHHKDKAKDKHDSKGKDKHDKSKDKHKDEGKHHPKPH
jgi:hypothetical protein